MKEDLGLTAPYAEFIRLYKDIFDRVDYYAEVADYEKSLKDRCRIGILSNLTVFARDRLDKQVNLSDYDYVFLSFEMECSKPSRTIFEKVEKRVPFDPEDILLIDDTQMNTEMAKVFGWNTLKATGLELERIRTCCEAFLKGNRIHE